MCKKLFFLISNNFDEFIELSSIVFGIVFGDVFDTADKLVIIGV